MPFVKLILTWHRFVALRNLIADGIVGTPNEIGWPVGSYIRPRKGVALGEAGVFPKALREMKQQKTEQKEEK